MRLDGRCRDLLTPASGPPVALAQAEVRVHVGAERRILDLTATPAVPGIEGLVGARAGSNLRGAIDRELPDERTLGTPLHLLLDDLAGASLVAGFVFFRWAAMIPQFDERVRSAGRRTMEGICSGFRPGASSLLPDGTMAGISHNVAPVTPLADPTDPGGWHELPPHPPMAMRRARRIDVWPDGSELRIDAMFRDSCWDPDGTEIAVHEYVIAAAADRASGTLTRVEAEPRVLPYVECPLAAANAGRLAGVGMRDLRTEVLERLRGTECCTHLNDALRALAEVPVLASALTSALA